MGRTDSVRLEGWERGPNLNKNEAKTAKKEPKSRANVYYLIQSSILQAAFFERLADFDGLKTSEKFYFFLLCGGFI